MFTVTLPRRNEVSSAPITAQNNPYKAQKPWPPDLEKLQPKYQFRLERRYRRRAKLRYTRPGWTRAVKLATNGLCLTVFVYGVLFMDWGTEATPFLGIRTWLKQQTQSIWTTNSMQPNANIVDNGSKQIASQDAGKRA